MYNELIMRSASRFVRLVTLLLIMGVIAASTTLPAAVPAAAQETCSAMINRFDLEFERNYVRFFIDLDIGNMREQEAQVLLWFLNSGDEFLGNGRWGDDCEDSQGNLMALELIEPCCNIAEYSRANGHTISIFVPYSEFPSVDYNYSYDT